MASSHEKTTVSETARLREAQQVPEREGLPSGKRRPASAGTHHTFFLGWAGRFEQVLSQSWGECVHVGMRTCGYMYVQVS